MRPETNCDYCFVILSNLLHRLNYSVTCHFFFYLNFVGLYLIFFPYVGFMVTYLVAMRSSVCCLMNVLDKHMWIN